jgi:hypothetical protein
MTRNLTIALAAVVIVGGGYFLYKNGTPDLATNSVSDTAAVVNFEVRTGEVAVTGFFDCTPLKSGEPIKEGECVMGLKGDDGKFYALNTLNMEDARDNKTSNLTRVRAVGSFTPADTTNKEVGNYKYDGVLTVRTIEDTK